MLTAFYALLENGKTHHAALHELARRHDLDIGTIARVIGRAEREHTRRSNPTTKETTA
jgi:hypothetical protein